MIKPIKEPKPISNTKWHRLSIERKLDTLTRSIQANNYIMLTAEKNRAKFNLLRKMKEGGTHTSTDVNEFLLALDNIAYAIIFNRFSYEEHDVLCDVLVNCIDMLKRNDVEFTSEIEESSMALSVYKDISKYRRY